MALDGDVGDSVQSLKEGFHFRIRSSRHGDVVLHAAQHLGCAPQPKVVQCSIGLASGILCRLKVVPQEKTDLINRTLELADQVEFQDLFDYLIVRLLTAAKLFQALSYLAQIFGNPTHSDDDFLHKMVLVLARAKIPSQDGFDHQNFSRIG
jgi:hypothetical protein